MPFLYFVPLIIIISFVLYVPSPRLGTNMTKMELQAVGDLKKRIIFSLAFIMAAIALFRRRGALTSFIQQNKVLVFLVIYAGFTVLWASSSMVAFKRWIQFAGFLLVIWCALIPDDAPRKIVAILRFLFVIALFASIAAVFIHPALGVDLSSGAWRGIFSHKNILGQVTALALILWLPALAGEQSIKKRIFNLMVIAMALLLLIKSNSKTALVISVVISLGWVMSKMPVRRELKMLLLPIPVLLLLFWMINFQNSTIDEMFISTLQRDTSFTGRTILWNAFTENIGAKTFLGSGYNSFWISGNNTAGHLIQQLGWDPGQAHNGYLDIVNELGIFGAIIFIIFLLKTLLQTWRFSHHDAKIGGICFLMIIAQILYNFVETSFCRSSSLGWLVVLVLACIATYREFTAGNFAQQTAEKL